jgi:hypothetical protein
MIFHVGPTNSRPTGISHQPERGGIFGLRDEPTRDWTWLGGSPRSGLAPVGAAPCVLAILSVC